MNISKVGTLNIGAQQYGGINNNKKLNNQQPPVQEETPDYSLVTEMKKLMQRKEDEFDQLKRDIEASKQSASSFGQSMEIRIKCMKIAGRIIAGNEVPRSDKQYLAKHDPEMLAMAEVRKVRKEDPKKTNKVADKEDMEDEPMNTTAPSPAHESAEVSAKSVQSVDVEL